MRTGDCDLCTYSQEYATRRMTTPSHICRILLGLASLVSTLLLPSCGAPSSPPEAWYIGTTTITSPDLNTTVQSSLYDNPSALRLRGDSLDYITFASLQRGRSYRREADYIEIRKDTSWLTRGNTDTLRFLVRTERSVMVVDSLAGRRIAEYHYVPARPEVQVPPVADVLDTLLHGAYRLAMHGDTTTMVWLDPLRVAVYDEASGARGIVSAYVVRIAGRTFLVLDRGFGLTKIQLTDVGVESLSGFAYGLLTGPVTLRPLVVPVVDLSSLYGRWQAVASRSLVTNDTQPVSRDWQHERLSFTDTSVVYTITGKQYEEPYRLFASAGMLVLPGDRLWLLATPTDTTLDVLIDVNSPFRQTVREVTTFRRLRPLTDSAGKEPAFCSPELLADVSRSIRQLTDVDIAEFMRSTPESCSVDLDYTTQYNSLLLRVLAEYPHEFRNALIGSSPRQQEAILRQLRQPDQTTRDLRSILAAYRKSAPGPGDAIEAALLTAVGGQ